MPVRSEGGKSRRWGRVVELPRETGDILTVPRGNPNEAQLLNKITHPTPCTSLSPGENGEVLTVIFRGGPKSSRLNLKNKFSKPGPTWLQNAFKQATHIPILRVGWLLNLYDVPDYFKLGFSREESGTNGHLLGPRTSAASKKQRSTPSWRGNTNTVSVLDIEEA